MGLVNHVSLSTFQCVFSNVGSDIYVISYNEIYQDFQATVWNGWQVFSAVVPAEEQSFALSSQSATERCRRCPDDIRLDDGSWRDAWRDMAGLGSNFWSPAPRHAAVVVPFCTNDSNETVQV